MSFVIRLGVQHPGRPLPMFTDHLGARWEHRCGWCDDVFMTAGQLVGHVCKERAKCQSTS